MFHCLVLKGRREQRVIGFINDISRRPNGEDGLNGLLSQERQRCINSVRILSASVEIIEIPRGHAVSFQTTKKVNVLVCFLDCCKSVKGPVWVAVDTDA